MITKLRKFKKKNFQNILSLSLITIFLFLAIGFLIFTNLRIQKRRQELLSQIEYLKKEIEILEEKNKNLRAEISQLENLSYWEEKIREQGYKKPGEEVVVIKKIAVEEEKEVEKEKGIFEKFLEILRIKERQ